MGNGGRRGDKEKNTSVKAQINQYCSGRGSWCDYSICVTSMADIDIDAINP